MRIAILLAAAALLSGCGGMTKDAPEIAACEYMAREPLDRYASTYKRQSAASYDESLIHSEMEQLRADHPAMMNGVPGVRVALIEYEYRGKGGEVFEGSNVCQFLTRDGNLIGGERGVMSQAKAYVNEMRVARALGEGELDYLVPGELSLPVGVDSGYRAGR